MEKIEDYHFKRSSHTELGRGSYSTVYLGQYNGQTNKYILQGTKVAIKIIKTRYLTSKAKDILNDEIGIMKMIKEEHKKIGIMDILRE